MFGGKRMSRVKDLVTVRSKNCNHHISQENEESREKRKEIKFKRDEN
jgi:hypothetical protein